MENITDYSVRIWDDDVFIHGRGINYMGGNCGGGMQCSYDIRSSNYDEVLSICKEIKEKFIRLNELVK